MAFAYLLAHDKTQKGALISSLRKNRARIIHGSEDEKTLTTNDELERKQALWRQSCVDTINIHQLLSIHVRHYSDQHHVALRSV